MKRFAVLLLAIFGAPVCLLATTHTVTVAPGGSFTFDPASQTINAGDTVMWVWGLGIHSTTSGALCFADDTWNSGLLVPPNSFSVTFPTAGTFAYFCTLHCGFGMTGQIVVQAVTDTPTSTPTSTPTPTETEAPPPTPTGTQIPSPTPTGTQISSPTPTQVPSTPFPPTPGTGAAVPALSSSMLALLALALAAAALFVMRRG